LELYKSVIVDTFDQLSPEWFKAVAGNPGASNADKIITTKGERSKSRDDYMRQLAAEFITGAKEETYTSQAMMNGMAREPASRALFEMMYEVDVQKVALVYEDQRKRCHCSPDGLVGDRAGLEMKNPMAKTHVKYLLEKVFPLDYFQQVQMSLYITERDLWYFMSSYDGLPPFIVEMGRNEPFIKRLAEELDSFCEELAAMVCKIEECGGSVKTAQDGPRVKEAIKTGPKAENAVAAPQPEELAPAECPQRPGDTMTVAFCKKCKDRLGCVAWGKK
jgi:YqaJ-like viral recombinase domain